MGDYIPRTEAEFNNWQVNLVSIVTENATAWSIPAEQVTALVALQTTWTTAYAKASNKQNRTAADVLVKNKAGDDFKKGLRNFVQLWLARNPLVADADRVRMVITVYTGSRTPVPAPDTAPIGTIDFSVRLQHVITFYDQEAAHSNAKPKGVSGCEIYLKVDGDAPVSVDEMQFQGICSASPFVQKFKPAQVGKTAWYWLRWVNSKGETGPWSIPVSAMVVG